MGLRYIRKVKKPCMGNMNAFCTMTMMTKSDVRKNERINQIHACGVHVRENNTIHTIRAMKSSAPSLKSSNVPKKSDRKPQKTVFKAAAEYRNP
jgi:predicted transcriptional regulator